jgi:hypothetical protein
MTSLSIIVFCKRAILFKNYAKFINTWALKTHPRFDQATAKSGLVSMALR